jgi:membrane fusion protein (multidrug efflux system)
MTLPRSLARCLLLLCLAAGTACERDAEGPGAGGPPPSVVEVERVEPRPFADTLELVGQLAAEESVVIRPEVAGVLEKIHFREGERVRAGQLLFTLRDDSQRAALREMRAELALARDVHQRTQALSRSEVAAEAELERARTRVEAAEAAVESARVVLSRTRIAAPFDGALGARHVSPGDWVEAGAALVQLDALDRLQLQFSLPESAVGLARGGLRVGVSVAPYPEERFAGEVYFVSPTLDPDSRRLELKAWVPNGEGRLRPGLFARVHLEVERTERALSVVESAVVYDQHGAFVWRVGADSTAERVPVELGPRRAGRVLVRRGLAAGDTVVTAGTHKVYPGSPLLVNEPDAVAGGTGAEADGG